MMSNITILHQEIQMTTQNILQDCKIIYTLLSYKKDNAELTKQAAELTKQVAELTEQLEWANMEVLIADNTIDELSQRYKLLKLALTGARKQVQELNNILHDTDL